MTGAFFVIRKADGAYIVRTWRGQKEHGSWKGHKNLTKKFEKPLDF